MTIEVGDHAPAFSLPASDGSPRSLRDLTSNGPALLVFFKTTCPTCKLAFPVYGEVERRYGDSIPVVAVAQDPLMNATSLARELQFEGLVLDDASDRYAASAAYGVETVPTLVLVDGDGTVVHVSEGWDRDGVNALAEQLGELAGRTTDPVSTENDGLPAFKPG